MLADIPRSHCAIDGVGQRMHADIGVGMAQETLAVRHAHRPRIVLVGMGTPKQELWVDRYADRLDGAVVWTVGALFDYVSGRTPRAPRWLARLIGLPVSNLAEWMRQGTAPAPVMSVEEQKADTKDKPWQRRTAAPKAKAPGP